MNHIQIYFSDDDVRSMNISEVQALLKKGELNKSDWALIDEWEGEWGTVGEIPGINTKACSENKIRRKTSRALAVPKKKSPLLFFFIIGIFVFVGTSVCLYFLFFHQSETLHTKLSVSTHPVKLRGILDQMTLILRPNLPDQVHLSVLRRNPPKLFLHHLLISLTPSSLH